MENTLSESNLSPQNLDNYFLQKQMELMIESNNKKLANELGNITSMISKLNAEISELKKQVGRSREMPARQESFAAPEIPRACAESRSISQSSCDNNAKKAEQSEPSRPRYGDYKPEDVSVDKFFYFGNKK